MHHENLHLQSLLQWHRKGERKAPFGKRLFLLCLPGEFADVKNNLNLCSMRRELVPVLSPNDFISQPPLYITARVSSTWDLTLLLAVFLDLRNFQSWKERTTKLTSFKHPYLYYALLVAPGTFKTTSLNFPY